MNLAGWKALRSAAADGRLFLDPRHPTFAIVQRPDGAAFSLTFRGGAWRRGPALKLPAQPEEQESAS